MIFRTLATNTLIIEEMLQPTLFENNLENYPLTWENVQPMTFSNVLPEDVVLDSRTNNDIVLKHITFVQSENGSSVVTNFLKIMTSMIDTWYEIRNIGFGINGDINMTFLSIVFFDDTNEEACEMTLMDYPGWDYGGDTFPSHSKC